MPKLIKTIADKLDAQGAKDLLVWDSDLKSFGIRVRASSGKTYFVQHRNADGLSRRLAIVKHGLLAPEQAHPLALKHLGSVAGGEDRRANDEPSGPA